jgi:hypothetical protein
VTGPVITPVAFPAAHHRDGQPSPSPSSARRTLPLPVVPTRRTHTMVYGMAAVDSRGRVADQPILHALGWTPGTRLNIRETGGLLVIHPDDRGVFSVTSQGHLRLPAPVRHVCGLIPGDRVLLAAAPAHGLLIVHPPAALDDLLAPLHHGLLGGAPA